MSSLQDHLDALKVRKGYWFAPKLYGYGAVPVTWQGWLTTLAFIALAVMLAQLLPSDPLRIAAIFVAAIGFIALARHKTDGGFAWRWGPEKR